MYVLEFSPPMEGIEGRFNTFRLGIAWSKKLTHGDRVLLINRPKSLLMGSAIVESVHLGALKEMATQHAHHNHNQRAFPANEAGDRLIQNMIKRYGPHRCDENKKVTVIYLNFLGNKHDASEGHL